jgi:hypothetical protein
MISSCHERCVIVRGTEDRGRKSGTMGFQKRFFLFFSSFRLLFVEQQL